MRIVLGFLSGVVGMLAGWFGLAFAVIALAGPDRDGGVAMGAFFNIGPVGALIGFAVGVWLFVKFGMVAQGAPVAAAPSAEPASASSPGTVAAPAKARISRSFAVVVLAIVGALAWWAWYELIRSPYLTHGDMTLALQFRLPADMAAPAEAKDVQIVLDERGRHWPAYLNEAGWRAHQGNRAVILASVSMMYKTSRRVVTLSMPGAPAQSWTLDLSSDPDPTPGYTAWLPSRDAPNPIELNYRLTGDR
jgi:MFS family permease